MLARAINFILSYTKLGELLNEKKLIIGAVLTVAAIVLEGLEKLALVFPDAAYLLEAKSTLKQVLDTVQYYLEIGGYSFLTVGLTHKAAKAKLAKAEVVKGSVVTSTLAKADVVIPQ